MAPARSLLAVHKSLDADALRALDSVKALVEAENAELPPTIRAEVVQDVTSIIRDRLAMLVSNGVMGLVLVILVMSLFFRPGYAIWVAMGLPVAFLGAFAWMALTGLSINMMTLVALLMAIGIVMDDSIVISDSIATQYAKGHSKLEAVVHGVTAVAPGVMSSFLTTVAVFAPLSFLSGDLGKVLEVLPLVLLAALSASLIEAFVILPHHLLHGLPDDKAAPSRFRQKFDAGFAVLRDRWVGGLADLAIAWRYLVVGLALGALILTVGALAGGLVKREAMPAIDGDVLEARIMLMPGAPLERTEAVVAQIESALLRVSDRLSPEQPDGQALVQRIITRFNYNASAGQSGAHLATVSADLLNAEIRTTTLDDLIAAWRDEAGPLAGVTSLILTEPGLGPQGIAVELRLSHPDLAVLQSVGARTQAELETYTGVLNATVDLRPGKTELRFRLAPGARTLGLSSADVASQISAAYLGSQLVDVRQGDITHEIEILLSDDDRNSRADLENFTITLPDGSAVPLATVATWEESRGWGSIAQVDGLRTLTVQADVDGRYGNADAITARLAGGFLPDLVAKTPGLRFEVGGQAANSAETVASILRGFLIGLVGIYLILSFQFRSLYRAGDRDADDSAGLSGGDLGACGDGLQHLDAVIGGGRVAGRDRGQQRDPADRGDQVPRRRGCFGGAGGKSGGAGAVPTDLRFGHDHDSGHGAAAGRNLDPGADAQAAGDLGGVRAAGLDHAGHAGAARALRDPCGSGLGAGRSGAVESLKRRLRAAAGPIPAAARPALPQAPAQSDDPRQGPTAGRCWNAATTGRPHQRRRGPGGPSRKRAGIARPDRWSVFRPRPGTGHHRSRFCPSQGGDAPNHVRRPLTMIFDADGLRAPECPFARRTGLMTRLVFYPSDRDPAATGAVRPRCRRAWRRRRTAPDDARPGSGLRRCAPAFLPGAALGPATMERVKRPVFRIPPPIALAPIRAVAILQSPRLQHDDTLAGAANRQPSALPLFFQQGDPHGQLASDADYRDPL